MIIDGKSKENILVATKEITSGGVVAFPTETVYGLGADAFNEAAVKKIFKIKGRPFEDPLILHIASQGQLSLIAQDIPQMAYDLIARFWPGPLTLILKKTPLVSSLLTAGLETVAVRMPRNIIALALIKNSGTVIAAPSANKFQGLSPTTAQAVAASLGDRVSVILDGGPCLVGLESTIIDLQDTPKVLRWGGVTKEELSQVLGSKMIDGTRDFVKNKPVESPTNEVIQPQLAPGLLSFHYAPKKPLTLLPAEFAQKESPSYSENKIKQWTKEGIWDAIKNESSWICFSKNEASCLQKIGIRNIFILSEDGNFEEAARNYFETLRKMDEFEGARIFAIELLETGLGLAINERLRKAQHT